MRGTVLDPRAVPSVRLAVRVGLACKTLPWCGGLGPARSPRNSVVVKAHVGAGLAEERTVAAVGRATR
eukprot:5219242-Prymnesium_polylepis.1